MRRTALALGFVGFLVNPGIGCGTDDNDPEFHYGATEMKDAVEGTWEIGISRSDGSSSKLTVTLAQAAGTTPTAQRSGGLIRPAMACGSRTLVKSANACLDSSSMPLDVTMTNGDPGYSEGEMSGYFAVYGTEFQTGELRLKLGDFSVNARVSRDGTAEASGLVAPGVTLTSLVRTSR